MMVDGSYRCATVAQLTVLPLHGDLNAMILFGIITVGRGYAV